MENTYKEIPGLEGIAEINKLGEVRTLDRIIPSNNVWGLYEVIIKGQQMKIPTVPQNKYKGINIRNKSSKRKRYLIHQLMAITFLKHVPDGTRSDSIVIDHIDENKHNNRLDNLQLISARKNIQKNFKFRKKDEL